MLGEGMAASEIHTAGAGPGEKAIEASASWQGSTTGSTGEATEEEPFLAPTITDCRRLAKMKADQEQRLRMLAIRRDRLACHEGRVWQDVQAAQTKSLQAQEAQWRRQAQQAERLRIERELLAQEQALRDRARAMREQIQDTKDGPRIQKFEENQAIGKQTREDSRKLMEALRDVKEQSLQSKIMRVEVRRQQQRQNRLRKELERTRKEQSVQDANALKYAELQEELTNGALALAATEREELSAVSRLQNSQNVRSEVVSQLQDIERGGLADMMDNGLSMSSSDMASQAPARAARAGGGYGQSSSSGLGSRGAGAAVPRSTRQGAGLRGLQGNRSRLSGGGRANGHMAGGCMGLGQIDEEPQDADGAYSPGGRPI